MKNKMLTVVNKSVGEALKNIYPGDFKQAFLDPPDNIGLKYRSYDDKIHNYIKWLGGIIRATVKRVPLVWVSFNAKWILPLGAELAGVDDCRVMIQIFKFGLYRKTDFGNNFRPLLRIGKGKFHGDVIRIESERQKLGDPRANPSGRVPGDVFDFPRVTGNNHQRRRWHPTQLNEGLVERCLKSGGGGPVLDLFSGTGTTIRVCKRLGYDCLAVEQDPFYCKKIQEEL